MRIGRATRRKPVKRRGRTEGRVRGGAPVRLVHVIVAFGAMTVTGCGDADREAPPSAAAASPAESPAPDAASPSAEVSVVDPANFDGSNYATDAVMRAHGERIAGVLACGSCHMADYTGANFGEMIPLVDGLWATNISRTLSSFSDTGLERLLREGVHPTRQIYLMPSKLSQWLGDRDMAALIAFLRTIPPAGDPTPPPPTGFEEAVTERLPDDYWRTTPEGEPRVYHNAAEEAEYFAANAPPDYGPDLAQGRLVALTVCAGCHGAALDGVGEPAGDIQAFLDYGDADGRRLLREGRDRYGDLVPPTWIPDEAGTDHVFPDLTDGEVAAVTAYVRRLAAERYASGG